jgi:hypothetical protein
MPILTTVILPNPAPVIATFVKVQYCENEYGYDIESIELYADAACKQLIADFCVEELPVAMQGVIYETIDNQRYREARVRGLRRLKADLEAMGARA